MARWNAGRIGAINQPTAVSAAGIWTLAEQQVNQRNGSWPPEVDLYITPAVGGVNYWSFAANGPLNLGTAGVYTITMYKTKSATVKLWGGSPSSWYYSAGAGGAASGTLSMVSGSTYIVRVGASTGGGGVNGDARSKGGGYSGIFITSETQANAKIIAGGGGGSGYDDGGRGATGGAGGGDTTARAGGYGSTPGYGASQSAGGAGGTGTYSGSAGSALTGGNGAGLGSYTGGGGGSGYFGGGGGGLQSAWAGGGGAGGTGYIGGVTGGTNYTGSGTTPGNSGDAVRGTAGSPGNDGRVYITA